MQRKLTAAVLAIVAALLMGSCSTITDQLDGAGTSDQTVPTGRPGPILETTTWGVVDGMLSVVVRNTSDRTLRYAEGVVTARTADDQLVASSLESRDTACCSVQQLAPGQQYGFYLDVGSAGGDISRVDVAYRNVAWDSVTAIDDHTSVSAQPVGLRDGDLGTVVLADLTSNRSESAVVAQAFLTDADGDLVAVVSGRWTCVRPGSQRLRMQLFHPVPPGTRVDDVLVHPVDDDPTRPTPACHPSRSL